MGNSWSEIDEIGFVWSTTVSGNKNLIIATINSNSLNSPYLYVNENNNYTAVSLTCSISADLFTTNNFQSVNLSNISINSSNTISFGSWSDSTWSRTNNWKSFYLKKNGTFVANLIPAVRTSDNEIGFYDKINDVFYTNSGTGEFLYG